MPFSVNSSVGSFTDSFETHMFEIRILMLLIVGGNKKKLDPEDIISSLNRQTEEKIQNIFYVMLITLPLHNRCLHAWVNL